MSSEKKIDDGGPAFPCEGGSNSGLHPDPGMSIRDWFSGQALTDEQMRMLEDQWRAAKQNWADPVSPQTLRYFHADAMLAARKYGGGA